MFFVVRSNDSFNFPLGWIKYIVIVVVIIVTVVIVGLFRTQHGTETRLCQRKEGRVQRVAELRPDCVRERRVGYRGWRSWDQTVPEKGRSGTEGGGTETRLCQRMEGRVQRVAEQWQNRKTGSWLQFCCERNQKIVEEVPRTGQRRAVVRNLLYRVDS